MGVPKFFRYISERYPCLSELVREYQIPEFDNMYLDMNGIIHMCSHPDDNNPHFRITEEQIFQDIFHYLEVLFRMIRPQKLFFMAIDGVAPRAKMNQQRGRRFRSAKDAEKQEAEAKKKGETLPTEARFDSNCITPGTVFMARLQEQLKYFVVEKISNDPSWKNVKVVLSGHETPGEGEHKIMDYIRYIRSQPGYDPNTRHCLYGLDADLIMLGLCTHEPHFSLLREEVKFGKKSTKRLSVPEEITFFLLHLSLMREYLELEFISLKDRLVGFEYNIENIIDDWVLMGFLVGNDFIPHLPHLHIANGALPILYKAYIEVLPTLDGYINEGGRLNLVRFEKFMEKLTEYDVQTFEETRDDLLYMEAKTGRKCNAHSKVSSGKLLEEWADESEEHFQEETLEPEQGRTKTIDSGLAALMKETEDLCISDNESEEDYEDHAFENYKKDYYRNKLEYANVTPEVMRDQAEGYVRAIQWNLNYYYNGVCSWSWYYPHHYAPYISDIKGFSNLKLEFDSGVPFKPYEQLLAVLPAASKNLLPTAYHGLMENEDSPLKKYYPDDFQTDLNGKRQEWEAVVLIPFMDENLLLEAMKPCNEKLNPEEKERNSHGPMLVYTYSQDDFGKYDSPGYFPCVKHNHCKMELLTREDIRLPESKLIKGAYPGISMNVYYPGFPTFKHLKYSAELQKAKVKVFEQPSRYENMIIKILPKDGFDPEDIPVELLGTTVFVGWPHLIEAKVVGIVNDKTKYISMGESNQYNAEDNMTKKLLREESAGIVDRYKSKLGIIVGEVQTLCQVQVMIGRKYVFAPNGRLTLDKQFSENTANYPLQTVVSNIDAYDSHKSMFRNALDVFPEGALCFTLSNPYYGSQGIVLDSKEALKKGRIKVCVSVFEEPQFQKLTELKTEMLRSYKTLYNVASQLGMSNFVFSRITSSIYVSVPNGEGGLKNVNIGLDLKFNRKNKETPGYTKRIGNVWYYTNKCTELVREYTENFPEVFVILSAQNSNDDLKVEEIFGDNWDVKIVELQKWLRTIPSYSVERQTCGAQVSEPEVVDEVEKIVDEYLTKAVSKKVVMQIKPSFLYKPEVQSGTLMPDPKMTVQIFDRVVNTRKGYSVPFGLKGTIVAITESPTNNDRDTMYDVVFDKPFKDGMQLNCSAGRGYRIPKSGFINISYGRRVYEEKAGKQEAPPVQNKWQNLNGEKFFTQFLQNSAHKTPRTNELPLAAPYNQPAYVPPHNRAQYGNPYYTQPSINQSAFASFNNQQKAADNNGVPTSPGGKSTETMEPQHEPKNGASGFVQSSKEKPRKLAELPKKEVLVERPVGKETNTRPHTVNTDFLKNLLKIGTTASHPERPIQPQKVKAEESLNVSFEVLAQQVANAPASVRLLTYYQSNGLGIPRYQYFQTGTKFKAQITLTNGQVVMGQPADNKELATESVAADVLQLLIKKTKTSEPIETEPSENFPVPPKTWVAPEKEKNIESDKALKAALHNPFVPTQVIKRQSSRTSSSSSKNHKAGNSHEGTSSNNDQQARSAENTVLKSNGKAEVSQPEQEQRKTKRKPRIAAKFGKKQ